MLPAFRVLAKMRRFRGGALDVFGRTAERKRERALIAEYEALVDELLAKLAPANYELAVSLASIPEHIRGYGHVKERHLKDAKAREAALLERFRAAPQAEPQAGVALAAAD
jgi:indolepyruvate ferredoxin oxidoreductase